MDKPVAPSIAAASEGASAAACQSGRRLVAGPDLGGRGDSGVSAHQPLGLQEGFWGAITAIPVVQTELDATRNSARDQFAGAATGGLIGAAVVSMAGQSLAAYALAVVLSMTACWLLNITSAARLAGSTATIIALVPHHATVAGMMLSRVAEVGWGVAVAIGVVWLANRIFKAKPAV